MKKTLSELMSQPVQMVNINDSLRKVVYLFNEKNMSAAAVQDDTKKTVGVITKTDLVRYQQDRTRALVVDRSMPSGFQPMDDEDTVEQWMTPVIFSVKSNATIHDVARQMVKYGVHHIFVRGGANDDLVGIVSSFDILRQVGSIHENDRL